MKKIEAIVRKAEETDWKPFWDLLHARGAADDEVSAKQRFITYISRPDHFLPIALLEDRTVGYGWAQDYGPHLRTGKRLHRFHDLFVLEEFRKKGIAAAIFHEIQEWSMMNGAAWLQWNANPSSTSFYKRLGFEPIPEEEEGFPFFEIDFT